MTIRTVRNLRRISQTLFFLLFFWLIVKTNFEVNFTPDNTTGITLPYPVSIFLEFDPLVGLSTLLANWTVYKSLILGLFILIPTIFFGRFFCGWVCPLGTLNHWISEIPSERIKRKGAKKIESNRYKKYQRIKYYIFIIFIAGSLTGILQIGLLDPISLLARSIGTVVLPMMHTGALGVLSLFKATGVPFIMGSAQSAYEHFALVMLPFRPMVFNTIFSLGLFFFLILILNRLFTRFWCRAVCPLGAMLGFFSRYAIFGLEKDEKTCDHCNLCLISCQGADNPDVGYPWRQTECHLCLNCQAACPQNSLSFKFFPKAEKTKDNPPPIQKVDVTRRKFALSAVGGLALYPLFRSGDDFEANANPLTIRPPGSVNEATFLSRCIRCGQCMRVCPNNALHPTLLEAGVEGIWSPILIAKIGYCEPTCTLCGEVCPTGAILPMTVKDKVGDKNKPPLRIGTAFIDRGRCLPWAMDKPCIVCEEWCPTAPKSIYLKEETVINARGDEIVVKRPYVDPEHCTGCGACEFACPVNDKAAIYITAVGESRSEKNQILLERQRPVKPN